MICQSSTSNQSVSTSDDRTGSRYFFRIRVISSCVGRFSFSFAFFGIVAGTCITESRYVNHPSPKGNGLLGVLRLRLRSLIVYAILILTGVSTSPLLYRIPRSTTLLLRRIFNAPFTSALSVLPLFVLYWPLCTRLPLN